MATCATESSLTIGDRILPLFRKHPALFFEHVTSHRAEDPGSNESGSEQVATAGAAPGAVPQVPPQGEEDVFKVFLATTL